MPPKSEKQRRFAYAVKAGKVKGVAKKVGSQILGEGEGEKTEKKTDKASISKTGK